jgi:hypothetical protein
MPALDQLDFKGLYSLRMIKNEKDYKEALQLCPLSYYVPLSAPIFLEKTPGF